MVTMRGAADNVRMTYSPADDVQMTCRRHMLSTNRNLQRSLTLVSSAHRPHIIHMSSACHLPRDFNPKIFPVKEQRTALIKIDHEFSTFLHLI